MMAGMKRPALIVPAACFILAAAALARQQEELPAAVTDSAGSVLVADGLPADIMQRIDAANRGLLIAALDRGARVEFSQHPAMIFR